MKNKKKKKYYKKRKRHISVTEKHQGYLKRRSVSLCVDPKLLEELGIPSNSESCIYLPHLPLSHNGYPMYKGQTVISLMRDSVKHKKLKEHATCHKCNNKLCVNPLHLYYGTKRDNWIDFVRSKGVFNFDLFFNVPSYDFSSLDKYLESKNNKPEIVEIIKK